MGQFVMSFRGINMHVRKDSNVLPPNVQHRVVTINAIGGYQSSPSDWGDLPPHLSFIEAKPEVVRAFLDSGLPPMEALDSVLSLVALYGWRLRLANPAGSEADIRLDGVFHLTDALQGMVLKEGIGNEAEVPEWAAAFVDIDSGTVKWGRFSEGGVYTTWSAETVGDPVLELTQTIDGAAQPPLFITIPSTPPHSRLSNDVPGSMVLHNGTTNFSDKQWDFMLYFLANKDGIPPREALKLDFPQDPPPAPGPCVDLTTSCSNSQYP
jgi:hypothetical protein